MVICVCNAIRERQLRETVRETGCARPCEAYATLGHRPRCGQCLPVARAVIGSELAGATSAVS